MKLSELVQGVSGATVRGDPGTEIRGLAYHTRDVADGTLFFCVPGLSFDGHAFAAAAVEAGAAALVCERDTGVDAAQVVVPSVRRAMALMASRWYGDPSRELRVVGVTGTNGKTTTAHLVAGLFAAAGQPAGLLGTVVNRIGGVEHPVKLTTAESLDLQRMFAEMVDAGDRGVRVRGQLARPLPGQGRRHRLRRRRLQQPDARPPRLPQGSRGLLRRQAPAVPARRGAQRRRRRGRERRRRVRRAARARVPAALRRRPVDLRGRRGRRLRRRGRRARSRAARRRLRLHARLPAPRAWRSA